MQHADALLHARILNDPQRECAQPTSSMRFSDVQLVDERVATAVLETVAQGQHHVGDDG